MKRRVYDVLVIGFGKAGKTIAMKRAKAGDRVALVEADAGMYGGTCINIGCVPTKILLTDAARFSSGTEAAAEAFAQAQARRNSLVARMNAANLTLAEHAGVRVVLGRARFTAPRTVLVETPEGVLELAADKVIVNTGSTSVVPDLPGVDSPRVHTSTSIQHIDALPKALVIAGGGPIGLEFATLFSGFGTQVTILERGEAPLRAFDPDVATCAVDIFERRGVEFFTESEAASFRDEESGVVVTLKDGRTLKADAALLALGRKPATEGLGLEAAGIETTARGAVRVDEHLRTTAAGVWAAGDVNGGPQFTYISFDDHRIIMQDAWPKAGAPTRTTEGRIIPTTTFLEPPLATVGLSERQARADGLRVTVKKADIAALPTVPRPKILGQAKGMAKFVIDEGTDRILGATLFCADAQELINTVALAMRHNVTAAELGDGIYTHPASSEIFNALLG